MAKVHDHTGQVLGKLLVLHRSGSGDRGGALWRVRCECGMEFVILGSQLRGTTGSQPVTACRKCKMHGPVTFDGQTLHLPDWAEQTGINLKTLYTRLRRGWTVERALTTPVRRTAELKD